MCTTLQRTAPKVAFGKGNKVSCMFEGRMELPLPALLTSVSFEMTSGMAWNRVQEPSVPTTYEGNYDKVV